MIIGIDVGSTTTKAVTIEDGKIKRKIRAKASDAITAATGAFGKMVLENEIKMDNITGIKITGVGASKISNNIFGIPTSHVDEIQAIGTGGMFLSGLDNIIITNIGTGTAIIEAGTNGIFHFGGSGVGGGTILGLAKKLLPTAEFSGIMELAESGSLNRVDLLLEDIIDTDISFLAKDSTAANFGKMLDAASAGDVALGILNMVYQVIGMLSVFAARAKNTDKVIVTGNGSNNHIGHKVLSLITDLYGIKFIYPENAEYATAVGAGLWGN